MDVGKINLTGLCESVASQTYYATAPQVNWNDLPWIERHAWIENVTPIVWRTLNDAERFQGR